MGLRPGAENIPGCVGLGAAASLAGRCSADAADSLGLLRDRFVARLSELISPPPLSLCQDSPRLPNTVAVEMLGDARPIQRAARKLVMATAQSDTPPDEMTRTLRAIGRSDVQIKRTLRISLGWTTSREQVDRAADLLAEASDGLAVG
jgi:cysteine desulfurase